MATAEEMDANFVLRRLQGGPWASSALACSFRFCTNTRAGHLPGCWEESMHLHAFAELSAEWAGSQFWLLHNPPQALHHLGEDQMLTGDRSVQHTVGAQ